MNYTLKAEVKLSPRKLRGYGEVSAISKQTGGVQVVIISCESAAKSVLMKSKFVSDQKLTGTSPYRKTISAFVKGAKVYIVSAQTVKQINSYAKINKLSNSPSVNVPMYLDAWDKYGFRFYYRPWAKPKGKRNYDPSGEFEFADKLGALGLVFWAKAAPMDYAYGLTNSRWWDWAARAATRKKLPIVINTAMSNPPWLGNLYPEQTARKMPQYCGSFHSIASPYLGGTGFTSWTATTASDLELTILQKIVKQYSKLPNTIEFLEPHGEPYHGSYTWFLEYGPEADKSFRKYLKTKYGSLAKVASRWGINKLKTWNDVHLPELASFLGWGAAALDLTGRWEVNYMKLKKHITNFQAYKRKIIPVEPAPESWYSSQLDDSKWGTIIAPGNDEQMFLVQRPALMRREFNVTSKYLKEHKQLWLYIWDLNMGYRDVIKAVVNDKLAGTDRIRFNTPHWAAFDVSKLLKSGKNLLALRLPKGYIGYRVYISPHRPKMYPMLGKHKNSQWVDFVDWRMKTTSKAIERGMGMIRQVDKNRSIICMAPDSYAADLRDLCVKYGAHFHNTGYMGAIWAEYLPMLMRGADLPFSVEPGGPASNLPGFKRMMGLYLTSGVNAVSYFIHIGNIMWNKPICEYFEKNLAVFKMFGKMHQQKSQVAILFNSQGQRLVDFPWKNDYNNMLPQGYWNWRLNEVLYQQFNVDGLMMGDFRNGLAAPYKVIIDDNNMIMSTAEVENIAAWVKKGGIFVAFVQTGRHSYEKADTWPISKLTGYNVINQHKYINNRPETSRLAYSAGQNVFDTQFLSSLGKQTANGIMLQPVAQNCQTLLKWEDGSTAVGVRKLGKGYVFDVGVKFAMTTLRWQESRTQKLLSAILKWCKIKENPAYAKKARLAHYVSNNGLKDIWVIFNESRRKKIDTELKFRNGKLPKLINIVTGKAVNPQIALGPNESIMLVSDRTDYMSAGLEWFKLQRNWWRGTEIPTFTPVKKIPNMTLNLNKNWKIKALQNGQSPGNLTAKNVNDSNWRKTALQVFKYPTEVKTKNLILRRSFTVPAWSSADEIFLSISSWYKQLTMAAGSKLRVWLDGKQIGGNLPANNGLVNYPISLKPQSTHTLALQIIGGKSSWLGLKGSCFIWRIPKADKELELSGKWCTAKDVLTTGKTVTLPGRAMTLMFRRAIKIPKNLAGCKVYLSIKSSDQLIGCNINQHYIRRHHHCVGGITYLNISPWIKFGATNEIDLIRWRTSGYMRVDSVKLYFYNK